MRSIIVPVSLYYISPLYITTSAAPLAANGTVDIFCVGPDDANKGRYMLVDIKAPLFLFWSDGDGRWATDTFPHDISIKKNKRRILASASLFLLKTETGAKVKSLWSAAGWCCAPVCTFLARMKVASTTPLFIFKLAKSAWRLSPTALNPHILSGFPFLPPLGVFISLFFTASDRRQNPLCE